VGHLGCIGMTVVLRKTELEQIRVYSSGSIRCDDGICTELVMTFKKRIRVKLVICVIVIAFEISKVINLFISWFYVLQVKIFSGNSFVSIIISNVVLCARHC